jgi:hypothetical protein
MNPLAKWGGYVMKLHTANRHTIKQPILIMFLFLLGINLSGCASVHAESDSSTANTHDTSSQYRIIFSGIPWDSSVEYVLAQRGAPSSVDDLEPFTILNYKDVLSENISLDVRFIFFENKFVEGRTTYFSGSTDDHSEIHELLYLSSGIFEVTHQRISLMFGEAEVHEPPPAKNMLHHTIRYGKTPGTQYVSTMKCGTKMEFFMPR